MHDRRRSASGYLRVVLLWLLAGLAATVATSWGLALWQDVYWEHGALYTRGVRARNPDGGEGSGWLTVERFTRTGAAFFQTCAFAGDGSVSMGLGPAQSEPDPTPEQVVPDWLCSQLIPWSPGRWPPTDPVGYVYAYVDARGWPMLALWCTYDLERPTTGTIAARARGAIPLPGKIVPKGSWFGGGYPPSLPLRPRWTGLLVNSLLFGAALWGLNLGAGAARRALRRRRGRCTRCGYDLSGMPRGSACSECGYLEAEAGH